MSTPTGLHREAFGSAGACSRFFIGRASFNLESAGKPARSKRFAMKAGRCRFLAGHLRWDVCRWSPQPISDNPYP
jgi:hypothetical protein